MKKQKVIELHQFPQEFRDKIYEKIVHCGGHCHWYPGDGFFKSMSEVKDKKKIHFYGKETAKTKDVYVYEEGDDPIGDWLMKNHNIKVGEEVLIIR